MYIIIQLNFSPLSHFTYMDIGKLTIKKQFRGKYCHFDKLIFNFCSHSLNNGDNIHGMNIYFKTFMMYIVHWTDWLYRATKDYIKIDYVLFTSKLLWYATRKVIE